MYYYDGDDNDDDSRCAFDYSAAPWRRRRQWFYRVRVSFSIALRSIIY